MLVVVRAGGVHEKASMQVAALARIPSTSWAVANAPPLSSTVSEHNATARWRTRGEMCSPRCTSLRGGHNEFSGCSFARGESSAASGKAATKCFGGSPVLMKGSVITTPERVIHGARFIHPKMFTFGAISHAVLTEIAERASRLLPSNASFGQLAARDS